MIKILFLGLVLLKVCLFVKLESSDCKMIEPNLQVSIDRKLDSIDRISCRFIFLQNFQFSLGPYDV